jgi:hypothetical protein
MPGSFVYLKFADPADPDLVYVDTQAGDLFLESDDDCCPDIHGEHGGVAQHEYPETGISGGREYGDAHGVAGMLTPTALLAVAIVMWQAWPP